VSQRKSLGNNDEHKITNSTNNVNNNNNNNLNVVVTEYGMVSDEETSMDTDLEELEDGAAVVVTVDRADSLIVPDQPPTEIRTGSAVKAMQSFPANRQLTPRKLAPIPPAEVDV